MDKSLGRRHEAKEDIKESESHATTSENVAAIAEPRHELGRTLSLANPFHFIIR